MAIGTLPRASEFVLGRHQTFHLRAGWLVKALDALSRSPETLSGPESHHALGVGKNMLEAIRYWMVAAELAGQERSASTRRLQLLLTPTGELISRHDLYFEDSVSLWVVHLALASNYHAAAAWYWLFNEAEASEFDNQRLLMEFSWWLDRASDGRAFSESQVRRELSCLRRTYVHEPSGPKSSSLDDQLTCPLSSLGLISRTESGNLQLRFGRKPGMPLEVFLFALHRFATGSRTVYSLDELRWERYSPGRLLGLDSPALLELLLQAQSHRPSSIRVTETAGLRQVTIVPTDPIDILAGYYARHSS